MSIRAMNWAWGRKVSSAPKLVLLALADHTDDDGVCWPGISSVAEKTGLSSRTVRRHVANLVRLGLVAVSKQLRGDGSQTANLYHLLMSKVSPPPEKTDRGPLTKLTGEGDTADTPILESSLNHHKNHHLKAGGRDDENSEWAKILLRDARFQRMGWNGFVEDIETRFSSELDLAAEALHAVEWLTTKKGQSRTRMKLFFINWLKRTMEAGNAGTQRGAGGSRKKSAAESWRVGT